LHGGPESGAALAAPFAFSFPRLRAGTCPKGDGMLLPFLPPYAGEVPEGRWGCFCPFFPRMRGKCPVGDGGVFAVSSPACGGSARRAMGVFLPFLPPHAGEVPEGRWGCVRWRGGFRAPSARAPTPARASRPRPTPEAWALSRTRASGAQAVRLRPACGGGGIMWPSPGAAGHQPQVARAPAPAERATWTLRPTTADSARGPRIRRRPRGAFMLPAESSIPCRSGFSRDPGRTPANRQRSRLKPLLQKSRASP